MALDLINTLQGTETTEEVQLEVTDQVTTETTEEVADPAAKGGGETTEEVAEVVDSPTPNFEWLGQVSDGRIKTEEDLQQLIQSSTDAIKPEVHQSVIQERDTFKLQYEGAYENDYIKGYNELVRGGASQDQLDAYTNLNRLGDLKDIDPREALVQKHIFQDNLSDSDARFHVGQKYPSTLEEVYAKHDNLDPDNDADKLKAENILRSAKISLQTESTSARDFLSQHKNDMSYSRAQSEIQARQEKQNALAGEWEKVAPTVAARIDAVPIKFKEGDVEYEFNVPIPQEFALKMQSQLPSYAAQQGLALSNENADQLVSTIKNTYLVQNWGTIAKSIALDAINKGKAMTAEEVSNPDKVKRPNGEQAAAKQGRSQLEQIASRQVKK